MPRDFLTFLLPEKDGFYSFDLPSPPGGIHLPLLLNFSGLGTLHPPLWGQRTFFGSFNHLSCPPSRLHAGLLP